MPKERAESIPSPVTTKSPWFSMRRSPPPPSVRASMPLALIDPPLDLAKIDDVDFIPAASGERANAGDIINGQIGGQLAPIVEVNIISRAWGRQIDGVGIGAVGGARLGVDAGDRKDNPGSICDGVSRNRLRAVDASAGAGVWRQAASRRARCRAAGFCGRPRGVLGLSRIAAERGAQVRHVVTYEQTVPRLRCRRATDHPPT